MKKAVGLIFKIIGIAVIIFVIVIILLPVIFFFKYKEYMDESNEEARRKRLGETVWVSEAKLDPELVDFYRTYMFKISKDIVDNIGDRFTDADVEQGIVTKKSEDLSPHSKAFITWAYIINYYEDKRISKKKYHDIMYYVVSKENLANIMTELTNSCSESDLDEFKNLTGFIEDNKYYIEYEEKFVSMYYGTDEFVNIYSKDDTIMFMSYNNDLRYKIYFKIRKINKIDCLVFDKIDIKFAPSYRPSNN